MIQGLGPVMSNLHNTGSNLTRHSSNHINLSLFLAVNENEIKKRKNLKKKICVVKKSPKTEIDMALLEEYRHEHVRIRQQSSRGMEFCGF
jgi:hypothetical protein